MGKGKAHKARLTGSAGKAGQGQGSLGQAQGIFCPCFFLGRVFGGLGRVHPDKGQRLGQAGNAEQWDALRDHAHALKGVASNLGLVKLAGESGDLMRIATWQLSREWRQRLQSLRDRLVQGRAALDARGANAARDSESN